MNEVFSQRKSEMIQLRKEGKTLEKIASMYHVSRQRVHQITSKIAHTKAKRVVYKNTPAREIHIQRMRAVWEERKKNREPRFWKLVDIRGPNDCWEWQGSRSSTSKYGTVNGKYPSRWAYIYTFGDPGSLHVLHKCDNPPCCNPGHLYPGTVEDNTRDREIRLRNPSRKVTDDKALEIYMQYKNKDYGILDLANIHGLSLETIKGIVTGKRKYIQRLIPELSSVSI